MSNKFEQYEHHSATVWVASENKGLHREHCLCYSCKKFNPGVPEENCPLANLNYAVCLLNDMVLPVWECPRFEEDPSPSKYL